MVEQDQSREKESARGNGIDAKVETADIPVPVVVPNRTGKVVFGLSIMVLGVALFLSQLGILESPRVWRLWWPFLIMALGVGKLAMSNPHGHREGGGLVFVGVWCLLNQLEILQYRDSWPLLLVGIGCSIVWKAIARSSRGPAERTRN